MDTQSIPQRLLLAASPFTLAGCSDSAAPTRHGAPSAHNGVSYREGLRLLPSVRHTTTSGSPLSGVWPSVVCMKTIFLLVGLFLMVGCKDSTGPSASPTGSVRVMVTTSGPRADTASRYSFSVDGGTGRLIAANGGTTIDGLSVGSHGMALAGMPSTCTADQNPRTVTISANATVSVTFAVFCATPTSYLRIDAVTTGVDFPDGYAISVDFQQATQPLGVNGAVVIPLAVGPHVVTLSGVLGNCVSSGNNYNPTVVVGDTTRITFSVNCVASGTLWVTAVTTGADLDPNGYSILVNGNRYSNDATVVSNGTWTVPRTSSGTFNISLGDVSENCAVLGSNPRSVTIPVHDTAQVTFHVSCIKASQIAFEGVEDDITGSSQIYVMHADGTSELPLTQDFGHHGGPAWSPDGSKIAFHTNRDGNVEVYVMNADGTGAVNLTHSSAVDSGPAWSPDGKKIAFYSNRDGTDGLYVMNANGSSVSKLTSGIGGFHPAWSPDGAKIAFDCQVDIGNRDICVINADGTGVTRLTNDAAADYEPAWKPDGSRILFVTGRYRSGMQLALMSPDGTGVALLSGNWAGGADDPAWSPDGTKIAFHSVVYYCEYIDYNCEFDHAILVANADFTPAGPGTYFRAYGLKPAWRP